MYSVYDACTGLKVSKVSGTREASFSVQVLVHPHFSDEFAETEIIKSEGEQLFLDCSVGGTPLPKVVKFHISQIIAF